MGLAADKGCMPSILDREAALDLLGGDEELLKEIEHLFLDQYPVLLSKIQDAVALDDARQLEAAAHTLKGSVYNLAAHAAAEDALQLELLGRSGDLKQAAPALERLEASLSALACALKAHAE